MIELAYAGLLLISVFSSLVLIPVSANLIITTFFIMYIGCHRSLILRKSGADHDKLGTKKEDGGEVMTHKDAFMFPVIGSCVLFSLYVAFQVFGKEAVNKLLAVYFGLVGTFSMSGLVNDVVSKAFPKDQKVYSFSFKIPVLMKESEEVSFSNSEVVSFMLSGCVTAGYFQTRHHLLNNLFGAAFSIQGMSQMSLGNYKTGVVLLSGLFLYDVFWVFGTDVMVTVAKSFDAPIKLLFLKEFATEDAIAKHSMLGLGDIVIPGIFIGLLLRFDAHRAGVPSDGSGGISFPKPYFNIALFSYVLGLATTVAVMFFFDAAQPALLYLVPACLLSSSLTALWRGELSDLTAYTEGEAKEDAEKKEKEEAEKKKKEGEEGEELMKKTKESKKKK